MDALYAPWRIQYILAKKSQTDEGSLFTRIAQSNDDVANHVICRDRTCYAVLNTYPYNAGHVLIVPYKKASSLEELSDPELLDLMLLTRRCQRALTTAMKPEGFNIGINLGKIAGAGIAGHLHIHLVPRWMGDTNFMPVIANTSVLPEALSELAARLRTVLAEN